MKPIQNPCPVWPTSNVKWWRRAANGDGNVWRNACKNSPTNTAKFPPLRQRKRRPLTLRSELGEVKLVLDYGQDRTGRWGSPAGQAWGLAPHQKITPGLAEKLSLHRDGYRFLRRSGASSQQMGRAHG